MLAVVANALYTTIRRYGTTQQLAAAIILCVVCALLLLSAIIWYNLRFSIEQASLSFAEVEVMLAYVALCGWLVPLSVTSVYYLFTAPRTSTISVYMHSQKKRTTAASTKTLQPRRYQSGVPVPFVFGEDISWGWLTYRNGRLPGQRLELKRAIVTIGRGEENDIWLDDEMASRYHAELAWEEGVVYITDCDSLNGVLINGRRIHGSSQIEPGEFIEIGSHRFLFELAKYESAAMPEQTDPLINHKWRSSLERLTGANELLPPTRPLSDRPVQNMPDLALISPEESVTREWQETAQVKGIVPSAQPTEPGGALRIHSGELAGKIFLLDRPVITVGRGAECEVVLNDISVSRRHAQFSRQVSGNYAQDLTSRNGTTINNELLLQPRLLVPGDIVCVGNIPLEYISLEDARTAPLSSILQTPSAFRSMSGPMPLKLPSKPKG